MFGFKLKDLTRAIVLSHFQRRLAKKGGYLSLERCKYNLKKKQGDLDDASGNHRFLNTFSRKSIYYMFGSCTEGIVVRDYRSNI